MYSTEGHLRFYLRYLFNGIDFAEKSMLDIGGGSGLFSLYAACSGASSVVCLEPEAAGSAGGTRAKGERVAQSLGLDNFESSQLPLQEYDPGLRTFDLLLLHNSINHLDEEACISLLHSSDARERYEAIFSKLSRLAAPGATLMIADCSPHNFFKRVHLNNPIVPTIEWEKHQSPATWARMLRQFDFVNPKTHWASFSSFGSLGRLLLGNKVASFFLTSHFLLTMRKQ